MLPTEIYYHIIRFADGLVRARSSAVCKMFNSFKFIVYTKEPEKDREVSLMKLNSASIFLLAKYGHEDILRCITNRDLSYALLAACYSDNYHLAKVLISLGVSTKKIGLYGLCRYCSIRLIRLLVENGVNDWNSGLCGAIDSRRICVVKYMIECGANNIAEGLTLLHGSNDFEIIGYLKELNIPWANRAEQVDMLSEL